MLGQNNITIDSVPDYTRKFESLGELLEYLESTPTVNPIRKCCSEEIDSNGFCGTRTMADAKELAVKGWREGTERIEKFSSLMIDKLSSLVVRDEYFYDVTGYDFDISRSLQGVPECWLNSETIEVNCPSTSNVRILANIGVSGGVGEETIMMKGAAIGALIMLLEQSRRSVELEVVWRSKCWRNVKVAKLVEFRLLVKHSGDTLDLAKLAFVLAHPSFLRRFGFAVMERIQDASVATVCQVGRGYGSVEQVKSDADIYVPGNRLSDMASYVGTAGAERWIMEMLKAQGVELKEGEEK